MNNTQIDKSMKDQGATHFTEDFGAITYYKQIEAFGRRLLQHWSNDDWVISGTLPWDKLKSIDGPSEKDPEQSILTLAFDDTAAMHTDFPETTMVKEARSIQEVNEMLAMVAQDVLNNWTEFMGEGSGFDQLAAPSQAARRDSMLDAIEALAPVIGTLVDEKRTAEMEISNAASVEQLGGVLGWSAGEIKHAKDSAQADYENECVLVIHSGREIRTPAYPEVADYVRITQNGYELAYWSADEFRESPEEVLGAMIGCAKNGQDGKESDNMRGSFAAPLAYIRERAVQ